MSPDNTPPSPITDEQAARIGAWIAKTVRRLLGRPKRFKFRVLTKDGQWHDEDSSGFCRDDARTRLREKYDAQDVLDL